MKNQHLFKITAFFLTLCICISLLPASAIALEAEDTSPDTAINLSDFFGGFVDPAELYDPLDKDTVPDIIGYGDAVSRNHIQRLYTDEGNDLYKIVFLNIDGTKTMYNFDFPVKFVDENGDIQDITLEIADSNVEQAKYETASNSAVTTFSARLSDGISLSGNGTAIKMVPILPDTVAGLATVSVDSNAESSVLQEAQRIDKNTIEYSYDNYTTIEYSLTYTGFKEDIVVSEYTGQTEYQFMLYTHGYTLTEIDSSYYLVDDTGKIKASIGDIIIFTADNRNNTFGQIIPTTIVEKQEYLLTIVVDESFLSNENTVYPIRIDPTVEINYDNNGAGAIQDVTISSQASSSGSSGSLYIGLRQSQGISRVLMKFPGLNLSSLGSNVEIQTATVTLRDLMCESTALSIDCHVFAGNSWSEDSATWSNVSPNSYSTLLSSLTMSYSTGAALSPVHRYSFDITRAVQGWIDGNYTQSKGIIFKVSSQTENGSTYNYRTVGSYNRSSYKPTLSITYTTGNAGPLSDGTYYLNNKYYGKYLRYTSSNGTTTSSGLLSSLGNSIQWKLQKVSGGYVIRSATNSTYYLGVPADTSSNSVTIVTVSDSSIPSRCIWSFLAANGGGGLIKNTYNSKYLYPSGTVLYTSPHAGTVGSSTYYSRVWRIVSITKYGNSASYANRELTSDTVILNCGITVGRSTTPTISKANTSEAWCSAFDFSYSGFSTSTIDITTFTGKITAKQTGSTTVIATHKVTGRTLTFTVSIFSLRVYQSKRTYYYDANGNLPEDLQYNDKTVDELRALDWINWADFENTSVTSMRNAWETMVVNLFASGDFEDVILDMIDHFMTGNGTAYSNSTLTAAIASHESTLSYTNSSNSYFKDLITAYGGDVTQLEFHATTRDDAPLVPLLDNIALPQYSSGTDALQGLKICVNDTWGLEISVNKFAVSGNSYSCTLHYKLYDHFGLDQNDVEKYGPFAGFRAWYILQHNKDYNGAYRPFTTFMEFDASFTGTF